MKKFCILAALLVLLFPLAGCDAQTSGEDGRINVVALSFPPYDFARAVAGDCADVTMLLSPGTELHSYDPTPRDIRTIRDCDLFLYGGGVSDAWMTDVLASLGETDVRILAMTELIELLEQPEEDHNHEADHTHDEGHDHGRYDEHVWTSPSNAAAITAAIRTALCELDPNNADTYNRNADAYIGEMKSLAADISDFVARDAVRRTLVFADRFPFLYFVEEFGLSYLSAFPGCAEQTEPGAQTIAALTKKVTEEKIPVVFYTEFSTQQMADSLCESTGAEKLLFHSCHNVSKSDFDAGVTYVSLMRQNFENLRKALQ
jgi:zinc transport system substrate-binding protein